MVFSRLLIIDFSLQQFPSWTSSSFRMASYYWRRIILKYWRRFNSIPPTSFHNSIHVFPSTLSVKMINIISISDFWLPNSVKCTTKLKEKKIWVSSSCPLKIRLYFQMICTIYILKIRALRCDTQGTPWVTDVVEDFCHKYNTQSIFKDTIHCIKLTGI